jgi:hypothetical protein
MRAAQSAQLAVTATTAQRQAARETNPPGEPQRAPAASSAGDPQQPRSPAAEVVSTLPPAESRDSEATSTRSAPALAAPAPAPVSPVTNIHSPPTEAPAAPPVQATSAGAGPDRHERESRASSPTAEDDEAAIRRASSTYAHAIETKDLALFRSIKPNLSREEERRLQDGFRAVSSQRVALTVVSIERRGDDATVNVRCCDTIEAGGRNQTIDSDQILQMTRASAGWVVVAIR